MAFYIKILYEASQIGMQKADLASDTGMESTRFMTRFAGQTI